jgi:hypothetical protein
LSRGSVGDLSTERPGKAGGFSALEVVLDGASGNAEHSPDRTRAY